MKPETIVENARHSRQENGSADAWRQESSCQVRDISTASAQTPGIFSEFRRKLACGEFLSRAVERLAEALRFSGRVTVTFHQGRLTKTVLEESYFRGKPES